MHERRVKSSSRAHCRHTRGGGVMEENVTNGDDDDGDGV